MRIVFVTLTLFILCVASVFAQRMDNPGRGTRVEQPANNRVYGDPGKTSNRIDPDIANNRGLGGGLSTFQFSAEVIKVHADDQQIEIRRKSNKTEHTLSVAPNCKIKADEKQFGKKVLSLNEIEPGYRVEVLLNLKSNVITEMKVKKPKA